MMPRLKKRPGSPNWQLRFQCRGKVHTFSCRTDDIHLAKKRARAYYNSVIAENYNLADSMKSGRDVATFGELFTAYRGLPEPMEHTKRRNIGAMKQLMALDGVGEGDRLDKLDAAWLLAWKGKIADGYSHAGANAVLRMAKSLFSRDAMDAYKLLKLDLPLDRVTEFMGVRPLREPQKEVKLPTPEALALADTHLRPFPLHYRAYLLARYGGLRRGEIMASAGHWLQNGGIRVGGGSDFTAKGKNCRIVPLPAPVLDLLAEAGLDRFLGPSPVRVVNELVAMLRGYGFPPKPLQSLRRWFLNQVADRDGVRAAQGAAGHSSIRTTEKSYLAPAGGARPVPWAS